VTPENEKAVLIIILVPDADEEARRKGFPEDVITKTSDEMALTEGNQVYLRKRVFERMRPEIESILSVRLN
jgi:hypothetical protein